MEWVQDPKTEIWHLTWQISGEGLEDGQVATWCHLTFAWDAPSKGLGQTTFMDTLHDECLRKSEEAP